VEPRSAPAGRTPEAPAAPPQQRWRLVLARAADAPRLAGRELADAWETAIEAAGLPVHRPAGKSRARVAFGAPLQLGIAAEGELADIFLAERVPAWRVRAALADWIPTGWRLLDAFDVWVGGPPLAGRVVGAVYRIELEGPVDRDALAVAARSLLEARELPRVREKGDAVVAYDLRPLLLELEVDASAGKPTLRIQTRIHPELGSGRPEEVVAALGERVGQPVVVATIVRERLILADEVTEP
jgi:radical SAM-linked protein